MTRKLTGAGISLATRPLIPGRFLLFVPFLCLYVYGVPKFGPFPVSPLHLFSWLYFIVLCKNPDFVIRRLGGPSGRMMVLLACTWMIPFIVDRIYDWYPPDLGLVFVVVTFISLHLIVRDRVENAVIVTRIYGLVLLCSVMWYLGEMLGGQSIRDIRVWFYDSSLSKMASFRQVVERNAPSGIIGYRFYFGYHLAVALPLFGVLSQSETQRFWRRVWAFGLIVSIFVGFYFGERSVLLGCAVAFAIYFAKLRRLRLFVMLVFALSIALSLAPSKDEHNMVRRLQEKYEEGFERIRVQWIGLEVIAANPSGLIPSGKSWIYEAEQRGARWEVFDGDIFVHNGYLGRVIHYGWSVAAFILILMILLLRQILFITRQARHSVIASYAMAPALATVSLIVHSCFHNSSVITFQANSIFLTYLALVWAELLQRSHRTSPVVARNLK